MIRFRSLKTSIIHLKPQFSLVEKKKTSKQQRMSKISTNFFETKQKNSKNVCPTAKSETVNK